MDLHGKVSEQLHLDLGAAPLEVVWPEDKSFVRALKFNFCKKLDQARNTQTHTHTQKNNITMFFVFCCCCCCCGGGGGGGAGAGAGAGAGVDSIGVVVAIDIA